MYLNCKHRDATPTTHRQDKTSSPFHCPSSTGSFNDRVRLYYRWLKSRRGSPQTSWLIGRTLVEHEPTIETSFSPTPALPLLPRSLLSSQPECVTDGPQGPRTVDVFSESQGTSHGCRTGGTPILTGCSLVDPVPPHLLQEFGVGNNIYYCAWESGGRLQKKHLKSTPSLRTLLDWADSDDPTGYLLKRWPIPESKSRVLSERIFFFSQYNRPRKVFLCLYVLPSTCLGRGVDSGDGPSPLVSVVVT